MSLFSGIGGLELGLARAGHKTILFCEIDPAAREVLNKRFIGKNGRGVSMLGDVRTLTSGLIPPSATLIAAGFPCQDLSQAGKTEGIDGRHSGLVESVFRLLRGLRQRGRRPWLILENVPFMLHLHGGRAMAYLADSLETLGYKWAYRVIDARAFGLPQRRRRVFLVASAEGDPRCVLLQDDAGAPSEDGTDGRSSHGFYWTEGNRGLGWAIDAVPPLKGGSGLGVPSPPAIWLREGGIVLPKIRDAERLQGLSPGWTKPAEHADTSSYRWKLVGNAVSVPAAKWLGRGLLQPSVAYTRGGKPFDDRGNWPPAAWNIGDGRFEAPVSAWPVRREMKPLHEFLREETVPLSERATEGFLGRLVASRLHVDPQFIRALRRHLRSFSNRKRPSKGIN